MIKNNKNLLRYIFGVILASFFLYLTLKGKDFEKIWETIQSTNIFFLILSIIIFLLTFVTRSEKWRIQVENLGYKVFPKSAYFALMLHYFFNSFTPKFGVIGRCTDLKQKNNIPFSACFGSYMSEVIFDTLFLLIGLLAVFISEFKKISVVFNKFITDFYLYLNSHIYIFIIFVIFTILSVFILYLYRKKNFIRKYKNPIITVIKTLTKTFKLKKFLLFFSWNILLWILLILMNYFLFKSLFDYKINFSFILTITTFTYFAWLMPTPGGIGSVEYFLLQAFLLFGFNDHDAISFGILSNGLTFLSITIFTSILMLFQRSTNFFTPKKKYNT